MLLLYTMYRYTVLLSDDESHCIPSGRLGTILLPHRSQQKVTLYNTIYTSCGKHRSGRYLSTPILGYKNRSRCRMVTALNKTNTIL